MVEKKIKDVLEVARNAPSGDNSQPWRFKLKENKLQIYNTPTADNPILNVRQRGSLIAHGAVIENICVAAPSFGLQATVELNEKFPDENLVANLTFDQIAPISSEMLELIKVRHTNRNRYSPEPLTNEQQQALTPSKIPADITLTFATTNAQKNTLAKSLSKAEYLVLRNERLHDLLFSSLVWTAEEETKRKHGLYVPTLELEPPARIVMKLAQSWSVMKLLIRIGLPSLVSSDNAKNYQASSGIGAIVAPDTDLNFIRAGQILEQVWLKAHALDMGLQPLNGLIFLNARAELDQDLLSETDQGVIKRAVESIQSEFNVPDGHVITSLFRIGQPIRPASARSSKSDLEDLIL